MRSIAALFIQVITVLVLIGCSSEPQLAFKVKNQLDFDRVEVVVLSISALNFDMDLDKTQFAIWDGENQLETQYVDSDLDGKVDALLFQTAVGAHETKLYKLGWRKKRRSESELYRCYSRFVPERTDDYAWENDRVAFRTFGPTAQQMVENGVNGGTLTSGIDCWLKKVDYPIIDNWYHKHVSGKGSYHEDDGEGLDNFHVGASRGCGGIAVKSSDQYWFSKNFSSWETHYSGPLRTSFGLGYEDWMADGNIIQEYKNVSLDLGSNLTHYDISIIGTDEISVGLTLHENDGELTINEEYGWISYWEPHEDSELAMAVIAAPGTFLGYEKYETSEKDLSNTYAHLKVRDQKAEYYTGFVWKKSGQFENKEAWEGYLTAFAKRLRSPLIIEMN
jgi:hypothetical protein